MSGRRNAGGAAAALNLMSQLLIQKQQEQKRAKERAAELYQKFAYEAVMNQVKKGTLRYDPSTGKLVQSQPAVPEIPSGLSPSGLSYKDDMGVTHSYAAPKATSTSDPATQANRVADLQNKISLMKSRDSETQSKVRKNYMDAYPDSEGYSDKEFMPWIPAIGKKKRPQYQAPALTDTSYLEGQLNSLMGGSQGAPTAIGRPSSGRAQGDPISQRIQQLRSSGWDDEDIASALEEKGVDPDQYGL